MCVGGGASECECGTRARRRNYSTFACVMERNNKLMRIAGWARAPLEAITSLHGKHRRESTG